MAIGKEDKKESVKVNISRALYVGIVHFRICMTIVRSTRSCLTCLQTTDEVIITQSYKMRQIII